MKKMIFTLVMALIGVIAFSQNVQYVNGYTKANGTYVQGYYRTVANNTVSDNFSTYPNVNPYTGQTGSIHYNTYPSYSTNSATYYVPTPTYTPTYYAPAPTYNYYPYYRQK